MIEISDQELSNITGGLFEEHDNNYSLIVKSYTCSKQRAITLIKEVLRIGMKEAGEIVDSIPKTILERLSYEEALKIQSKFIENNIEAEIVKR